MNKVSGGGISTLITISYSFKIDPVFKKNINTVINPDKDRMYKLHIYILYRSAKVHVWCCLFFDSFYSYLHMSQLFQLDVTGKQENSF